MKKVALINPFPTTGYHGQEYFCDRKEETTQLIQNIENNNSTTLIAIRRIGKTGLIHHTLKMLPKAWRSIYIDILTTENLTEFLNALATSIIQAVPQKSSLGKKFWEFIQTLRPIITFDSLTGLPQASFDITQKNTELNISSVLKFIDNQDFKTVIAIDEFQQILNYPEKNTDTWLRTIIQQLKNVVFVFSGSQQHLMTELFASPSRPFYRSVQFLRLGKIHKEVYADFINKKFQEYNKEIDIHIVYEIIEWCNGHTYYVQQIFNRIFSATKLKVSQNLWYQQANQLIKEQELVFINFRNLLTAAQWKLLKAIATEGLVYSPTSKKFISNYKLTSSASLLRSLDALRKYELVYSDSDIDGKPYYSVYDVFFQKWCKEKAHRNE